MTPYTNDGSRFILHAYTYIISIVWLTARLIHATTKCWGLISTLIDSTKHDYANKSTRNEFILILLGFSISVYLAF